MIYLKYCWLKVALNTITPSPLLYFLLKKTDCTSLNIITFKSLFIGYSWLIAVEDVTYSTSIEWTPATQHNTSGYVHKQRIGQVELWFSAIAEKLCTFRYHDLSVNFWIQFGTKSDIVRSHYCLFWKKKVTFWIFNIVFFFLSYIFKSHDCLFSKKKLHFQVSILFVFEKKVAFSSLNMVSLFFLSYIFKSQYCLFLKKKLHFQVSLLSVYCS